MVQYSGSSTDSTDPIGESPSGAFQFLIERARDFLLERGGSAPEELLIRYVFGASKSPQVWKSLFDTVMSDAPQLRKRGDGQWAIAGLETKDSLLLGDFVALDVETTGLKPVTHRVIEIGMVRYRDGKPDDRYVQLVQPGRKLPRYITKLTGIQDADLADAPTFDQVAEEVESFIGDALIVGHNVEFDIRFISAELKRAGRQSLINDRLDTLALAPRLLPNLRRPSLDKVARALGMSPRKLHRALADAELTSQCALLLLEIARDKGIGSIEELRIAGRPAVDSPREGVGRARALLDRSHLENIPRCPGVYLMRDQSGRIIYVGKAKNLRERVSSYYAQPLGYTRKMDGLIESIDRIDVERTGTELEALILEAQLIRRYQPRYNSALRAHEQYPYIRVTTSSPWPRICLAQKALDNGDRYFGPYRNQNAAKRAVGFLNSVLPLRTCTRSFKSAKSFGSSCLRLSLGQCLGPCVDQTIRGGYLAAIETAIRFLEGQDQALIDDLHRQLEVAAERQDFERARNLRNAVTTLQVIETASRRLSGNAFERHWTVALPNFDGRRVVVAIVAKGMIWAKLEAERGEPPDSLAERLARSYARLLEHGEPRVDRTTLDDTMVITRWLEQNSDHPAVVGREKGDDWDWEAIAQLALDLTYDEFVEWQPQDLVEDIVIDATAYSGGAGMDGVVPELPALQMPTGEFLHDATAEREAADGAV